MDFNVPSYQSENNIKRKAEKAVKAEGGCDTKYISVPFE